MLHIALLAVVTAGTVAAPLATGAAAASGDLVIDGRGWGHGRGMGQYGAFGYATDHGWSTDQILAHFYGGTTAATVDPDQEITVRIGGHDDRPLVAQVDTGAIGTYVPGGAVTAGSGRAIKVESVSGGYRVSDGSTCAGPFTARPGTVSASELRVAPVTGTSTTTFGYGTTGDIPLTGDWDGDGVDSPGVWRDGTFFLRNSATTGAADITVSFGSGTDTPVVGDWDGNGVDTIGFRRGNVFNLRNSNTPGPSDITFGYGRSSDAPVIGDWDGNRTSTVGVRRGNAYYLRNANSTGVADITFGYGTATDAPVVGDWDGDGHAGVGVRRGTTWYLRNPLTSGPAQYEFSALGPGAPVAARWHGGSADVIGRVSGGTWEIADANAAGGGGTRLEPANDLPLSRTLQLCHATTSSPPRWTSAASSVRYYRGELRLARVPSGSAVVTRVVNGVGLDWYLRSVVPSESIPSWGYADCVDGSGRLDCGQRALEAQAVAARSYSLGESRATFARTCDTTACQVYMGRSARSSAGAASSFEYDTTTRAVQATPGLIRRMPDGAVARTEFSSSTGGWTAGGVFPSVVDEGDDTASNKRHTWRVTLTPADIEAKYGQSGFRGAKVVERTPQDGFRRAAEVEIYFATGTVTRTGDQFRWDWGLNEKWIHLSREGEQVADMAGIRRDGSWYLKHSLDGGTADATFPYGEATDTPLVGDWDGDRIDGIAVRSDRTWSLRQTASAGTPFRTFAYGLATDAPLTGDWDGNGTAGVGVRRGNVWHLKQVADGGAADISFGYGAESDVPVIGDWDGDGRDSPGVFRDGTFHLRNSLSSGGADSTFATGRAGVPVVGDWDADGADEVGVFHNGLFTLFLGRSASDATIEFQFGRGGDVPVIGRWR